MFVAVCLERSEDMVVGLLGPSSLAPPLCHLTLPIHPCASPSCLRIPTRLS